MHEIQFKVQYNQTLEEQIKKWNEQIRDVINELIDLINRIK